MPFIPDAPLPRTILFGIGGVALGWLAHAAARPREVHLQVSTGPDSMVVAGSDIVVSSGGSVVYRGNRGRLRANTGSARGGSVLALDSDRSQLSARTSGAPAEATDAAGAGAARTSGDVEDHSVRVSGHGHVVSYDDANIFVNHRGVINSNTGDTDSSGLNAVDTFRSEICSGPSGSAKSSEDSDDVDTSSTQTVLTSSGEEITLAYQQDSSTSSEQAESDGMDDVSLTVTGVGHVVAEDDGTVVVGGRGMVNAQVGDSDTGGTVAMHVVRSTLRGGRASRRTMVAFSPDADRGQRQSQPAEQ